MRTTFGPRNGWRRAGSTVRGATTPQGPSVARPLERAAGVREGPRPQDGARGTEGHPGAGLSHREAMTRPASNEERAVDVQSLFPERRETERDYDMVDEPERENHRTPPGSRTWA